MTDHQQLAEGYGDASVPCSTKTGVIPTQDDEVLRWLKNQTYTYYGKDGKPVLARDLEDERDALKEALQKVLIEYDKVDLAHNEPRSMVSAIEAARNLVKSSYSGL